MGFNTTTLYGMLLGLIVLSGFFSAAEIGMMSLNRYRLKYLVKKKHKSAIRVNRLLKHPDKLLSVVLIGNTLANILASMLATLIGQHLYGDVGVMAATFLLTIVILIFSEMTPKTFAAIYPEKVAFLTSGLLRIMQIALTPFVFLVTSISNALISMFGISLNNEQKDVLSREEFRTVVHEASGLLPTEHKSMLISLLDLEQATVEDIMVPKSEIVGIDISMPWSNILEQFEMTQHTRLPLYKDNINHLVGMVHLRDILNLILDEDFNLEKLLSIADKPYFVPEKTPLNVQMLNFKRYKHRSCFVVNEYGDLLGLATLEDILEEVVGEFTTNLSNINQDIVFNTDGSVIVDGSMTLRYLNRSMGTQFPFIGPRTLSGLIIEYLGTIPVPDSCLQIDKYRLEILRVVDNVVKSVKIYP